MRSKQTFKWILFLGITVLVFLLLLEVSLRIMGFYTTAGEKDGRSFYSAYNTFDKFYNWIWLPNEEHKVKSSEFEYSFTANSLGIRDKEHGIEKKPGTYRILMMGDSYIESFGSVNNDSIILNFMETILNDSSHEYSYEVMGGGVAGSDLFFSYLLFQSKLIQYQPDLVVLNVNATDIMDYCVRGGLDRIASDGSIKFLENPVIDGLYSYSHIYRLWVHEVLKRDRNTFLTSKEQQDCERKFIEDAQAVLQLFKKAAVGYQFRLVLYPYGKQQIKDGYPAALDALKEEQTIDLRSGFAEHEKGCNELLYWPIDGHFTPHGYYVFSKLLVNRLQTDGALNAACEN